MKLQRTVLPVIAALLLAACGAKPAESSLAELLAGESRPAEDRARDAGRKPAEVIAAMGIEPGMQVLEILAAGGWYTEVLSIAVGPTGQVTAHNTPGALQMREGANAIALSARLAGGRLANVRRLDKDFAELSAADGQFDAAFTALNLHDIYNRGGDEAAQQAMSTVYAMLKPGGFFVVIDHDGVDGRDNAGLHRMPKADAVRVATAAGFFLDADSEVLHSDVDDMTRHIRDEDLRGFTNRFVLRFRKPQ
jgi:predicted methyltransferase